MKHFFSCSTRLQQITGSQIDITRRKDPVVLRAIAHSLINTQDGDANYALDLLNAAVKRDKKNAENYLLMGDAYRKPGNGTEAYKSYQTAFSDVVENLKGLTKPAFYEPFNLI